jgi:hypothetical protein
MTMAGSVDFCEEAEKILRAREIQEEDPRLLLKVERHIFEQRNASFPSGIVAFQSEHYNEELELQLLEELQHGNSHKQEESSNVSGNNLHAESGSDEGKAPLYVETLRANREKRADAIRSEAERLNMPWTVRQHLQRSELLTQRQSRVKHGASQPKHLLSPSVKLSMCKDGIPSPSNSVISKRAYRTALVYATNYVVQGEGDGDTEANSPPHQTPTPVRGRNV